MREFLENANILNIYRFGSVVYNSVTKLSDSDYIFVVREYFEPPNTSIQVYTVENFQLSIDNCDIAALECLFLSDRNVLKCTIDFKPNIDKSKLRRSISTISSNSWVKGKKKLIVSGDYNPYVAIKSIFHSLRILDFGIQLSTSGVIYNYSNMSWLLYDLMDMSEKFHRIELWNKIDDKYRSLFRSKKSLFKSNCSLSGDDVSRVSENPQINIQLRGRKFSPKELGEKTTLPIEVLINSGDISKVGRYRGEPSPYGIGIISFEFNEDKILEYSKILSEINCVDINLGEITFDFILNGCESFKLSNNILKSLCDINADIIITNLD